MRLLRLKKRYTKSREAQSNQRLIKTSLETFSSPGVTLMIDGTFRSTLKTSSLMYNILKNWKESVTQHGFITFGVSGNDFIFCPRKIKSLKSNEDSTISVRIKKKNYSRMVCTLNFQNHCFLSMLWMLLLRLWILLLLLSLKLLLLWSLILFIFVLFLSQLFCI